MTEQTGELDLIADEAAFVSALGLNPGTIKAGTVNIVFLQGRPHITFEAIHAVPPRLLGAAFLASSQSVEEPVEEPKKKPPAKRAPAKKAAKR